MREVLLFAAIAAAEPADHKLLGEGTLEFRCDKMQVFTTPNRSNCRGNVLVRRGDLLVCCQVFEGFADERWQWHRFVCSEEVRAQRPGEVVWAERAEFVMATADLILTGKPRVHRGANVLEGSRVVIDVKNDDAHIDNPRVRIATTRDGPAPEPATSGPLPPVCPISPTPPR